MKRTYVLPAALALLAVSVVGMAWPCAAHAQVAYAVYPVAPTFPGSGVGCCWYRPFTEESSPDVLYNFFVPGACGSPAAAYPAPYPTPILVGHTYFTYQPLMPHEFLYKHHRSYHQYYDQGMGMNRTLVRWTGTPVRTTLHGVRKLFELPR